MSAPPAVHGAPITSRAFVRDYVVTMRPYLLFVSGITGILGLALGPPISLGSTLLLAAVCFLSYGFGQALTDCFQTDTDALSSPYRPLVQGRIARRDVLLVSLTGLLLSGVVAVRFHPLNAPLAILLVLGLASYTWFKRRWWAGPFWNAWIVAALGALAWLSAVGGAHQAARWAPGLGGALLAVFFGYANFVLSGYYKDVSADRATGYRTLPVVAGPRVSAWVSDAFALLALAGCALTALQFRAEAGTWRWLAAAALLAPGLAASLLAQLRLHRVDERTAHRAIAPVVHAYILLLSGLVALARPAWTPPLWAFYALFLVAMRLRPMREQI
jgi:4-hydroxybenzoate polyprenyltransferase